MKYVLILAMLSVAALAQDKSTLPVSVDVAADRTVTITVPLDPAFHAFVIWGMVFGGEPRQDDHFQKADLRGAEFKRVLSLPPGQYSVFVGVRNLDSEGRRAWVNFTVK